MRRKLLLGGLVVVVLAGVGYFGAAYGVYRRLAYVEHSCDMHLVNRPDQITNVGGWPEMDFTPFLIPADRYIDVRFPSRDANLAIAGWYAAGEAGAPSVIVVDGLGGCRHAQAALLPAGMLWRAGYHVLVIDLRDTGDSDLEDGLSAVGSEEYQDVLGAWDWLIQTQGFDPSHIGIVGNSLGGATVLNAFGMEPRVAAIFLNSPFANLPQILREELARSGYPGFLTPGAVIMARLFTGDDIVAHSPLAMIAQAGDRPVFVAHSRADPRVRVHHSEQLQAAAQAAGAADTTFWYVDEAKHMQIPALYTDEFQANLVGFFDRALGQ